MRKCPRCHSSMVIALVDVVDGYEPAWKCIGCGREILADAHRQMEDEQLQENIRRTMETSA